jgi:hypothetical protein
LSAQKLFNLISRTIARATESTLLTYQVDSETGPIVVESLDEDKTIEEIHCRTQYNSVDEVLQILIMPTDIHDAHQSWMVEELGLMFAGGFLLQNEWTLLRTRVGTTTSGFSAPYSASRKQSDFQLRPRGEAMPTIAFESGWSEPNSRLHRDLNLWIVGGAPVLQAVFLLKWSRLAGNRVSGTVSLYTRDNVTGNPFLVTSEQIFPAPPTATAQAAQTIPITRGQLFGRRILIGQNPNDTYNLSINRLRSEALDALQIMGLQPA